MSSPELKRFLVSPTHIVVKLKNDVQVGDSLVNIEAFGAMPGARSKMTVSIARDSAASGFKDRETQKQKRIQRYNSACGCEFGSVFLIGATIVFFIYFTVHPVSWSTTGSVLRGLLWVIFMSGVGKLVGLTYARIRLHMLLAEQRREFFTKRD